MSIQSSFERICASNPNDVALITHCNGNQMTYGEMNYEVNKLARYLLGHVVPNRTIVAISIESGLYLARSVITMMSVLKSGGAFVNVPSELPLERKRTMLSYCDVVITESTLLPLLPIKDTAFKVLVDGESWKQQLDGLDGERNIDEGGRISVQYICFSSITIV